MRAAIAFLVTMLWAGGLAIRLKTLQHDRVLVGWPDDQIIQLPLVAAGVFLLGEGLMQVAAHWFAPREFPTWLGLLTGTIWAGFAANWFFDTYGLVVR